MPRLWCSTPAKRAAKGDTLISVRAPVGEMNRADQEYAIGRGLAAIRAKDGCDPGYLHHALQRWRWSLQRVAQGTTFDAVTSRHFAQLSVCLPRDSDEQSAIARVLDAVDTALERTRGAVERAREVKRALVQRVFSEGLRHEPTRKSTLGHLPRSWCVAPAGSVVTSFQYGLSVPMQLTGTLPILRMGNIQDGDVLLSDLKFVTLPPKVVDPYLLRRGDVLFNRTNSQEWVGKVGIFRYDTPAVFASYLIRLVPDVAQVDSYYLGHVLASYPSQCRIKRYATPGVQQVNINATNLGKVLIPLPVGDQGLQEQREIAGILEAADAAVRSYEPVLAAQLSLKQSLIHDLLTGRVRVRDASEVAAS
jgi:type I restriction enzyme S subunit